MGYHTRVIFDGNMKELWDFNRSSVKSYLFFLIYFRTRILCVVKTPEINQLEKAKKNTHSCVFSVRNKEWSFR